MKQLRNKRMNKHGDRCVNLRENKCVDEHGKKWRTVLIVASVASMVDQFNMMNIRVLLSMGYRVHVACNFREGNTCDGRRLRKLKETLRGMRVVWRQWDCPRDIRSVRKCQVAYRQLWELTGRFPYEWMHCHSPVGGALARMVAHRRGIRVVYTAHGFHFYKGAPIKNWMLYYPAEKLLSKWTDVLVTVNREDYSFAKRHLKARRVCRIPGVGVDTGKFTRSAGEKLGEGSPGAAMEARGRKGFCREYRIPEDACILLSVGELSKRKNHRIVVDALARLPGQDAYYVICGQGAQKERLARYAKKRGVSGRVRMLGFQEDMARMYHSADIFVFPSLQEGMPMALMEAMAAGLPCIVSDIRGNRELIGDAFQGVLFCPGNPLQLQEELAAMMEDDRLRQMCGRHNQARIQGYRLQAVEDRTREIYRSMGQRSAQGYIDREAPGDG